MNAEILRIAHEVGGEAWHSLDSVILRPSEECATYTQTCIADHECVQPFVEVEFEHTPTSNGIGNDRLIGRDISCE